MSEQKTPILVGSIIHLENALENGGYLETRGWVSDKPVITKFHDPRIRAFVFTHKDKNRSNGSGSWGILSAGGKGTGEHLMIGDKIHLLNIYAGTGYLDSFEWVRNLEPFKTYPMTIGVFTASSPNRGGGRSGTWTIQSADGVKKPNDLLYEGDAIYLENDYPGAGVLQTYDTVTDKAMFSSYDGQQLFVFTGPSPNPENSSHVGDSKGSVKWIISLSNLSENLYHIQYQWHDEHGPWHEGGVFKIGGRLKQPVVALNFTLNEQSEQLSGTVTYKDEISIDSEATEPQQNTYEFQATQTQPNLYAVKTFQDKAWHPDGQWQLGSREAQNIIAMDIELDNEGNLTGEMTYAGEGPIRFKGIQKISTTNDTSKLWYDVYRPGLLKGRTDKIEGVIEATYRLLSSSCKEISGHALDEAKSARLEDSSDINDQNFQIEQLLNLHALSQLLNDFFQSTLQTSMKQSLQKHRLDKTLPPLHLIRACFRHIAADHEIVQQATIQRRWNKHLDQKYYMSEQGMELMIMDKLAIKALAPFQHLLTGHPSQLAIITYLSEKTHIHRVPYTNQFILIGVSYDRVPSAARLFEDKEVAGKAFNAFELMAIPHEVGHYIYQHGKLDGNRSFEDVSRQFEGNTYYQWRKEIFADVYGCMVAGPLSALGMQALLASIDRERAWKDDEDHPTPVLRIFILAEILRILNELEARDTEANARRYRYRSMPNKLDNEWVEIVGQWGYDRMGEGEGRPARIYLPNDSIIPVDTIISVERVIAAIRPIIIEFATHLLVAEKLDNTSAKIPWSQGDYDTSESYNADLTKLTGRNFAREKFLRKAISEGETTQPTCDDASTADEYLQCYLKDWGDSGPLGSGRH